jgi:hypothetical protein
MAGPTAVTTAATARFVWLTLLVTLVPLTPASAQQPVEAGRIRIVTGSAVVVRAGQATPAQAGQAVFEGDELRTSPDGQLGITFSDDTRLALGPNANVNVTRYLYSPSENRLGLVLNVLRGAVAYVSGRLAKLAPDAVRLETPAAIVGVRGTSLAISVEAP